MTRWTLRLRGIRHYALVHAAVVLGVATAVAVLAGSLVVGDSVRGSLSALAVARLGGVSEVATSPQFFREALADDVRSAPGFGARYRAVAPLLALRGSVARSAGGSRAGDVLIYGVDGRFFALHGRSRPAGLEGRGALLSPALAEELHTEDGESLVLLVESSSDVPGSALFGRRTAPARRVRLTMRGSLARDAGGELSLRPSTQDARAVFVALDLLQRALDLAGRVNTLAVADRGAASGRGPDLAELVDATSRLEDRGLRVRPLPERVALALESASAVLDDATVEAARRVARQQSLEAHPVLIYLARTILSGEREVPYSLVAALDDAALARLAGRAVPVAPGQPPPLVLNEWAAADLRVRPGDPVVLDYDLWKEEGRLDAARATFRLDAIVPLAGAAADRDLVPDYPGITQSAEMAGWDPPFPVDLSRVRPRDEDYWDRHRATPKAFVPLAVGQRLWGHRLGSVTSLRLLPADGSRIDEARRRYADALARAVPPALTVSPVRYQALSASRGTTDFGEYFVYFSFFLMAAAILLAGLFFRLGLEQRSAEVGLLRAVGFTPRGLVGQFLGEGLLLSASGAVLGAAGAVIYARLVVLALRTLWQGAVGTSELSVHVTGKALALGAVGGVAASLAAIAWTLRGLGRRTPRALLAGALEDWSAAPVRPRVLPAAVLAVAGAFLAAAAGRVVDTTAAFFGAGALLLAAALVAIRARLRGRPETALALRSVPGLGMRAAAFRPGRSLLCIALVAGAVFVIVAVGAFRHDRLADLNAPTSESGGFTLVATASQPIHHDPRTPEGQAALGLPADALEGVTLARFRRAAGEDASCLNLYRPSRPTLLGAEPSFLHRPRFAFQDSLAHTEAERANPWRLLEREASDGAVPVAADATTLRYVLHKKLGEEMALGETGVRVRFVAVLRPGLLQSELITSERHLLRAFPAEEGYRFFLMATPPGREARVAAQWEAHLADLGFDVVEAAARLRAYHRVENTYIAAFQTLGALGLLLGVVGLTAVLLRNVFERRRELALLQAVGFGGRALRTMVWSENALLLLLGVLAGLLPALLAIAPALRERGGALPFATVAVLSAGLVVVGMLVSAAAVMVVRRLPLLAALRSE
jgi:hypothetical protein